jgi:predicted ABC-type ATPase
VERRKGLGSIPPRVVLISGPNGAGKSTVAPELIGHTFGFIQFVNADTIAQGLSALQPESTAITAGRIMLNRLQSLVRQRDDFAFETTLASRSFAPWIADLKRSGYSFFLMFLYLPTADMAVARVAGRVQDGGHSVPETTIRRRFKRGLQNFFQIYRPMADAWWFLDSSQPSGPEIIACQEVFRQNPLVMQPGIWRSLQGEYT